MENNHWQDSSQVVTPEINDTSSLLDNDLGHIMYIHTCIIGTLKINTVVHVPSYLYM